MMNKLIVANWKSHKTLSQAKNWLAEFQKSEQKTNRQYVVCPPFPFVPTVAETARQTSNLAVGVQDISPFEAGAYTGAVSALNLEGLDVRYVIIGHSERRRYFHETNQDIARKIESALTAGITPIVCMDKKDIDALTNELDRQTRSRIIPTYEPVDAISTFGGNEHPIEEILATIQDIRTAFQSKQVLYGGSVDPDNALVYLQPDSIDGVLVGSASLEVSTFLRI